MKITIEGEAKEIAALVTAIQERQEIKKVLIRKPYETRYVLVDAGTHLADE